MQCPRCGSELFPGMTECPECGSSVTGYTTKTATVIITGREARQGTYKILHIPQQASPIKVRIKAGTRNGTKLTISNAMFVTPDGDRLLIPVRVTVVVKREPLWLPLCVALLSLSVMAGVWQIGKALVNPADPDTPSRVQATRPSTQIVMPAATDPEDTLPPVTVPSVNIPSATVPTVTTPPATAPEETQPAATVPAQTQPPATQPPATADTSILYYEQRPFLHQMSDDLFENLEVIYDAAMAFETTCEFPNPMTAEELNYLTELMHTEFPELMQIDNTVTTHYYTDGTTGLVTRYDLPLVLTEQQYDSQYAAVRQVIDRLVAETQGMTDWEKEKYVFDYITETCTYSMDGTYAYTPYGTLVDKIAKCDGISLAMKWIMEEMGITCLCISGDPTVTEVGHAWNMIQLDGKYYCVDVTMDVRKDGDECPTLYCALNVTNDWVIQTYVLDAVFQNLVTVPVVTTMEKSYHVQNDSYVTSGSDWREAAVECFMKAYESGEPQLLQFESQADFEACLAGMDDEIKEAAADADIWNISWNKWYSKEFHVLHLTVTQK